MTEELKKGIEVLSKKYKKDNHLLKIGEECSELSVDIFKYFNKEKKDINLILNEISDVLNTIDIYLESINIKKEELDEYRLKQVLKHI